MRVFLPVGLQYDQANLLQCHREQEGWMELAQMYGEGEGGAKCINPSPGLYLSSGPR